MKTKLQQFKERNQKRNAHLYATNLLEGYDYVFCPISYERLSMIKDNYITNILEMNIEDYPKIQRICLKRKENIKVGLKQIDQTTGLTKYEVGQQKARKILSEVDEHGLNGYDRKGQKTRATHMANVDELGRNGYSRLATKAILKGNQTKANKGMISLNRGEFKRYKTIVLYLTEKFRKEMSKGFITGLAGKEKAYHIDHKFSILSGYQQKISPLVIGHRANLEMISWQENLSKHSSCSITAEMLLHWCCYSKDKSESEFDKCIQLITNDIENNVPPNAAFLIERLYESTSGS